MEEKDYATRCRFVDPTLFDRIPISGGNWIEVKKQINVGEKKRIESAGVRRVRSTTGEVVVELDHTEYSFVRTEVWLKDWSLKNKEGKDVGLSTSAIRALDEETFDEIENAISSHIEKLDAEKKARAGDGKPSEI